MKKKLVCVVAMLTAAFAADGNAPPKLTLEQQMTKADLVFIGAAEGTRDDGYGGQVAVIRLIKIIKGNHSARRVEFLVRSGTAEFDPNCCVSGQNYFILAMKIRGNLYRPVNGINSAFRLG